MLFNEETMKGAHRRLMEGEDGAWDPGEYKSRPNGLPGLETGMRLCIGVVRPFAQWW
jgi:hypothetical protein